MAKRPTIPSRGPKKPNPLMNKASKATKRDGKVSPKSISEDLIDFVAPPKLKQPKDKSGKFQNKPWRKNSTKEPHSDPYRDHKGRFVKRDPMMEEANKLFPPNTSDDVEELVSPPKPPAPRKPRQKRPKDDKPEDQLPFYNDPLFDLGYPEDSEIAKKAQIAKLEGEKRVHKAIANSILRNMENNKLKKKRKKDLIVRRASNDDDQPISQEELRKQAADHLKNIKKKYRDGYRNSSDHSRSRNDNDEEPDQDDLAALMGDHLDNVKRKYKKRPGVDKTLDPANDEIDSPGSYTRAKVRASANSGVNAFGRFKFKRRPNYSRSNRSSPGSSLVLGNVLPKTRGPGAAGNNSGMKVVNGKVKFRKLKQPKNKTPGKGSKLSEAADLIPKIFFAIMTAASFIMMMVKGLMESIGNTIIDGINKVLGLVGIPTIPRLGSNGGATAGGTGSTLNPNNNLPNDPNALKPVPNVGNRPDPSVTTPQSTNPTQTNPGSTSDPLKPVPSIGGVSAPGADRYVQEFKEVGTQSQAMQYFMSKGWTKPQSAGIVANLQQESGLNTAAFNKGENAWGIAQWRNDRLVNLGKFTGKNPKQTTFQEQLDFVHHELTAGNERAAGAKLAACQDATTAAVVVDRFYERSAGLHTDQRIAKANSIMGGNVIGPNDPTPGKTIQRPIDPSSLVNPLSQMPDPYNQNPGQAQTPYGQNPGQAQTPTPYGQNPLQPVLGPTPYAGGMSTPGFNPNTGMPSRSYGYNPQTNINNNIFRSIGSAAAVSPNVNIIEQLISQAGNLRQGRMHPFALPGMSGGANPLQLIADASAGGRNGAMNIVNRLFNSPKMVSYRTNFPQNMGITNQPNNVPYNNQDPQGRNEIVDDITNGIGGAIGSMTKTLLGAISSVGGMVSQNRNQNTSIGQMHIHDPRLSSIDRNVFSQRQNINP